MSQTRNPCNFRHELIKKAQFPSSLILKDGIKKNQFRQLAKESLTKKTN
jgi:hypothetical protein